MVFQSYALYPHMTVYDNLAFGLRNHKVAKPEIDRRVQRAAEILDLADLIKRKPKQLSGGQRQRVALGRAIVREPEAFLMDEPLSNLDAALRVADAGGDPEAAAPALDDDDLRHARPGRGDDDGRPDRRDEAGRAAAGGDAGGALHARRRTSSSARFIGSPAMNVVPATFMEGAGLSGQLAGFRPEHVSVGNGHADAAHFSATVEVVEYLGDEQLVHLAARDQSLLAKLPVEQRLAPGEEQQFSIARDKLHLFDADTELALT